MFQYKYCSNCGELFNKVSDTLYLCPKCDFRIFINPKPAAGAILYNKQGEIMLLERTYDPGKGLLGLPGGFIDPGENAVEGLERELKEELGLEVEGLSFFGCFSGDYPYKNIVYKTVDIIYTANLPKKFAIKLSNESKKYAFYKIEDIPLLRIGLEDVRKALTELVLSKRH